MRVRIPLLAVGDIGVDGPRLWRFETATASRAGRRHPWLWGKLLGGGAMSTQAKPRIGRPGQRCGLLETPCEVVRTARLGIDALPECIGENHLQRSGLIASVSASIILERTQFQESLIIDPQWGT